MHRLLRLHKGLTRCCIHGKCVENSKPASHISSQHSTYSNTAWRSSQKYANNLIICRTFHQTPSVNSLVSFKLSDIGEGIKEVEMKEWFVAVGDEVSQFDDICEVQSDKASATISSRYDGIIKKLHYEIGDVAQVGHSLVDIEVEGEESEESGTAEVESTKIEPIKEMSEPPEPMKKSLATPVVRRLAMEHNINLADIKGSGDNGRILKDDILIHVSPPTIAQSKQFYEAPPPAIPKVEKLSEDKVEQIKGIRKAMFTSMNASLLIPHFGYDDEYDLTELVSLRYKIKKQVKHNTGLKLSYMPFIIKATSLALSEHQILNSQIDLENNSLIYKADHNISVATDTPHGLLLPCIKQVQNLSILEITAELNRLHEAGLQNKISPADISGGTFSLSNIGNIGGTYARPVIFPPQVAIGALGRIQVLPRFDRDGNVVKAHTMCVSWSGDHRVIEGATMARFSNLLKEYLEEPSKMLLHLK